MQENEAVANERGKRGLEIVYTDAMGAVMEFVPALQISHGASNDEVPCTRSSIPRYILMYHSHHVGVALRFLAACRGEHGSLAQAAESCK